MKLDIYNGSSDKIVVFEGDNLLESEVITLIKDDKVIDLTGLTCDMGYVDINTNNGDIIENLKISSPTEGKIELPINSSLTKKDGIYDCELRLKSSKDDYVKFTAFFSLIVKANVFNRIGNGILKNDSFSKIQFILDNADKHKKLLEDKISELNETVKNANDSNTILNSTLNKTEKLNTEVISNNTSLKENITKAEDLNKKLEDNSSQFVVDEEKRKENEAERIEAEKVREEKINEFGSQVAKNTKEVKNKIDGIIGNQKFNKNDAIKGFYITDTGNVDKNNDYCASDWIGVIPNETYFLSVTESWGFQFCYYDENKSFLSKTETSGKAYTIPSNAYFVRFTFKPADLDTLQFKPGDKHTDYEPYEIKIKQKTIELDMLKKDAINALKGNIVAVKKDNGICIGFKYNTNEDMRILFKPCGQSNLPQINNIYKFNNKNDFASLDFSSLGNVFQNATTDWVGPYIVRTNNNDGDKPDSWEFTGGWHGFNGDQTGSATARNINFKYYIDNIEILDNNVRSGNEVKIVVVNRIQSTDTKKSDGNGREVLEETITYIITKNNIKVDVEIKALEWVRISTYYGLQTNNHSFDGQILYTDDETMKKWTECSNVKIDGGTKLKSTCYKYKLKKNNDMLIAYVDGVYGLGRRKYVTDEKPVVWTADYNKSYMVLINGNCVLQEDEVLYWRGGYKFLSLQ